MKVLLIDDDPILCAVLSDALRSIGFCDILVAENGLQATELYRCNKDDIGLISCDLHMPDFDGIEFVGFLSKNSTRCPIIFLTSADSTLRKSAVALSMAGGLDVLGCLSKPLDVDKLGKLLRDIVPASV